MVRCFTWVTLFTGIYCLVSYPVHAQWFSEWTTNGFDAQRSFWVRRDPKISTESIQTGQFRRVWEHNFSDEPRRLNSLQPPILFDFYIGYRGFRSLGFVSSGSGRIFVVDTDLARMEWVKNFDSDSSLPKISPNCPGGMTANVTRPTPAGLPPIFATLSRGRSSPAVSGVGEPHKGAVTLQHLVRRPATVASPSVEPTRERELTLPWATEVTEYIYALTEDGLLHARYVADGNTNKNTVRFLDPHANAHGLIVVDNFAYVSTTNGCGGVENGVWAVDLHSEKVINWRADGEVAGIAGPVFGPDGVLYVATAGTTSSSVVSLNPKTLEQTGSYTPIEGLEFTSSPLVINYRESDLLAVSGTDGRIHLLKGTNLDDSALTHRSEVYSNGKTTTVLSTWRDRNGITWVIAPSDGPIASSVNFPATNGDVITGAITAWKIVEKDGKTQIEPGWISRDMVSPLPSIIVNGVVFAVASREFQNQNSSAGAVKQVRHSSGLVMYALDGTTGEIIWKSEVLIKSSAHGLALSAGGGNVYLVTHDSTLHSFGFPMEH